MTMNTLGVHFFEPGDQIVEFLIINKEDNGTETRESLFTPSVEDIQAACFRHGVPADGIVDIIRKKEKGVHTFFLNVQEYLKGLEEQEQTFLLEIIKARPKGYANPSYSWDCPMCDFQIGTDLSIEYVEAKALGHLGDGHRVLKKKIRIEIEEQK